MATKLERILSEHNISSDNINSIQTQLKVKVKRDWRKYFIYLSDEQLQTLQQHYPDITIKIANPTKPKPETEEEAETE